MLTCRLCGMSHLAEQRFCGECGEPIGTPRPVAGVAAGGSVAERRVCSVLFCDLVGFTALAEGRDPEDVRELLSGYFEVASTVIRRYGGVVEKFIGDAVMAVWGAPLVTETDAERAVRAALDLLRAVEEFGLQVQMPGLVARAGIVTGQVAVTLGAANEGMVAGDPVNTAARVQSAADAGTVFVDTTTHRLTQTAVGYLDTGLHQLKGKSERARLWRASGVLSGLNGAQRLEVLEAPLVARDRELRAIAESFQLAVNDRTPRLMVVTGPAGVGKSRLSWEFRKHLDGLAADVFWHRGRCLSFDDGAAFSALKEVFGQRLGIAEGFPSASAARLMAGVAAVVSDPDERGYVGVRLARLLGVPHPEDSGAPLGRDELFAGWRIFLERLAQQHPVVLLIEDAQHADRDLLDFLDHLMDWSEALPVYVLVLARPELADAHPEFGAARNRTTLALNPLEPASMNLLLDRLVPGMAAEARKPIIARAQGIALFAVETVRSLVDREIVQAVDGVFRLVGTIDDLTVPDSLHGLLVARLDALPADTRTVLCEAAVLGSAFPAEALTAVSGRDEQSVRTCLAELLRREVLTVIDDPLSPERGSYRFTQDMLRSAAYAIQSRRDRKRRHLRVAERFAAEFPDRDDITDVLARHYQNALGAVPDAPDASRLRALAARARERAGDRAFRIGAPERAVDDYVAAAVLCEHADGELLDHAAELWDRASRVEGRSDWPTVIEHAQRARRLYIERGDTRAAGRTGVTAGRALRLQGQLLQALDEVTAALHQLHDRSDEDTVYALDQLATIEGQLDLPESREHAEQAFVLAEALGGAPELMVNLLLNRGVSLVWAGRDGEAAGYLRQSARAADEIGSTQRWGLAMMNLADLQLRVGDRDAQVTARAAVARLRQIGSRHFLGFAMANLVLALLDHGDWDGAQDVLSQGLNIDGLGDQAHLVVLEGRLAALRGDADRAEDIIGSLDQLRDSDDDQDRADVALVAAIVADSRNQPDLALHYARDVLHRALIFGPRHEDVRWAWPLAARAAHTLGDGVQSHELQALLRAFPPDRLGPMLIAERDLAAARTAATGSAYAQALEAQRMHSTPYHCALGHLDHAAFLAHAGDATAAREAVRRAEAITSRLHFAPPNPHAGAS